MPWFSTFLKFLYQGIPLAQRLLVFCLFLMQRLVLRPLVNEGGNCPPGRCGFLLSVSHVLLKMPNARVPLMLPGLAVPTATCALADSAAKTRKHAGLLGPSMLVLALQLAVER